MSKCRLWSDRSPRWPVFTRAGAGQPGIALIRKSSGRRGCAVAEYLLVAFATGYFVCIAPREPAPEGADFKEVFALQLFKTRVSCHTPPRQERAARLV